MRQIYKSLNDLLMLRVLSGSRSISKTIAPRLMEAGYTWKGSSVFSDVNRNPLSDQNGEAGNGRRDNRATTKIKRV